MQRGPDLPISPSSEPPSKRAAVSLYMKGRLSIIQITKYEAELIRELCPEAHIRIVNGGKSSKAKNRYVSEEHRVIQTLGMIRGTTNKKLGGYSNAV